MDKVEKNLTCLQDWLSPLSGENPCGKDVSFEPEFEELKSEVDKSFSVHQGYSTNWTKVLEQANAILKTQSKDLWVYAYAVKAAYECHGLPLCIDALASLTNVVEKYWGHLHPSAARLPRRAAPLHWLCARVEKIIQEAHFPQDKGQSAKKLKESLQRLAEIFDANLDEHSPDLKNIINLIPQTKDGENSEPYQTPSFDDLLSASQSVKASSAHTPDISSSSSEPSTGSDLSAHALPAIFRGLHEHGQRLGHHFLQQNMTDWRIYMLHRASLWCTITQLPSANADGVTQLRPLPRDKSLTYTAAVNGKRFGEILPQLERSASKMPYWFDGHYMVAKCLEGLNASEALLFVQASALQLITMFPELSGYKYFDETPFASPQTIQWFESLKSNPGLANVPDPLNFKLISSNQSGGEDILCEALAIYHDHGFHAGLKHLGHIPPAKSRSSINHGLISARYFMATDHQDAAMALLQELYHKLEEWDLLDWEPALSADILSLLISAAGSQRTEISGSMSRRLYWLHLETALDTFK